MTRRNVLLVLCAAAVLLVAGGLMASNMGFKLNRQMLFIGTSSGTHTLSLPYNRQIGIDNADQLLNDMRTTGSPINSVANIQAYNSTSDSVTVYSNSAGQPAGGFALNPCECYLTQVTANVQYITVGSHDPSLSCTLKGLSSSASGTNFFAPPYHATYDNADEMLSDLKANSSPINCVSNVQAVNPTTDSVTVYSNSAGQPAGGFAVNPGECYFVQVNTPGNCSYSPSHY
jgi:hypothetical protein